MDMRTRDLLATLLTLSSTCAIAQEAESLAGVRLRFDRGSTRSLALGSTGIASKQTDLATINPAAVAGARRSLSVDWGRRAMEGRYVGDATLNEIDAESSTRGVRSASLILPFAGLTWALAYDSPLDISHSTVSLFDDARIESFFVCGGKLSPTSCDSPMVVFNAPVTLPIEAELELRRYGVTAAWSNGPFAAGATIRQERLRQRTVFTGPISPSHESYAGPAETTDDADIAWGAGATWDVTPKVRVGATYSSGGAFAGSRTFADGSLQETEFRTPPSAGIGVSFDPVKNLTLAIDAVRVQYSEMMHDRRNVFPQGSELGYADVDEIHVGAEYRSGPFALRAGWWRDPAHALALRNTIGPPPPFHYAQGIVDDDDDHVTAGIGFGSRTRLDASVDRSSRTTQVALGISTTF